MLSAAPSRTLYVTASPSGVNRTSPPANSGFTARNVVTPESTRVSARFRRGTESPFARVPTTYAIVIPSGENPTQLNAEPGDNVPSEPPLIGTRRTPAIDEIATHCPSGEHVGAKSRL